MPIKAKSFGGYSSRRAVNVAWGTSGRRLHLSGGTFPSLTTLFLLCMTHHEHEPSLVLLTSFAPERNIGLWFVSHRRHLRDWRHDVRAASGHDDFAWVHGSLQNCRISILPVLKHTFKELPCSTAMVATRRKKRITLCLKVAPCLQLITHETHRGTHEIEGEF